MTYVKRQKLSEVIAVQNNIIDENNFFSIAFRGFSWRSADHKSSRGESEFHMDKNISNDYYVMIIFGAKKSKNNSKSKNSK